MPSQGEAAIGRRVDAAGQRRDANTVLALMKKHPASAYVTLCGLFNLAQLANGSSCAMAAAKAALAALRAFPEDAGVAGNACCVLGNAVLDNSPVRLHVVAKGGVSLIFRVCRDHIADHENAAVTSCHALATLARDPIHALAIDGAGGARLALELMRVHPANDGVLSKACTLLGNLALHTPAGGVAVEAIAPVSDALEFALRMASVELDDEEAEDALFSMAALLALDALFCLHGLTKRDSDTDFAVANSLQAEEAAEVISEALRTFPAEEQIYCHGLHVLLHIITAGPEEHLTALREAGVEELARDAQVAFDANEPGGAGECAGKLLTHFRASNGVGDDE
jgi:hypothetical protein